MADRIEIVRSGAEKAKASGGNIDESSGYYDLVNDVFVRPGENAEPKKAANGPLRIEVVSTSSAQPKKPAPRSAQQEEPRNVKKSAPRNTQRDEPRNVKQGAAKQSGWSGGGGDSWDDSAGGAQQDLGIWLRSGAQTPPPRRGVQLPQMWGVDLVCILITIGAAVWILRDLDAAMFAVVNVICSFIGSVGGVLTIVVFIAIVLRMLRRR